MITLAGNMAIQSQELVFATLGSMVMVLAKTRRITILCYRFISAASFQDL